MFRRFPHVSLILCSFASFTLSVAADVSSSDAGKDWEKRKTHTVRPAKAPDELSSYGGWAKHKVAKTGFFHLIKEGKQWWLVDPEGHLYLSIGVNSVEPKRVKHDSVTKWSQETHALLTETGFNSIGRWSAPDEFQEIDKEIPWCSTFGFMKNYLKERPEEYSRNITKQNQTIPVFDKEWPEFCERYAKEKTKGHIDNPFIIGHFSDNELDFRPNALELYLELPENDPGHQAAVAWMKENRVSKGKVDNPKTQAAFLEIVAKKYYETVAAALKKFDPNHLYIGSRLHGRSISEPVLNAANACDIVSVNYYHAWEPEKAKTANWTKWSKKPFLVGEFYAMKVTSKRLKVDGAGFRVLNHEDAGEFYHTYTSTLLKDHPNCVGWHWFKYADAFDDHQKGIVGLSGKAHQPLIDSMKIVNEQAYSIRGKR